MDWSKPSSNGTRLLIPHYLNWLGTLVGSLGLFLKWPRYIKIYQRPVSLLRQTELESFKNGQTIFIDAIGIEVRVLWTNNSSSSRLNMDLVCVKCSIWIWISLIMFLFLFICFYQILYFESNRAFYMLSGLVSPISWRCWYVDNIKPRCMQKLSKNRKGKILQPIKKSYPNFPIKIKPSA